jgi:hypothetical protein
MQRTCELYDEGMKEYLSVNVKRNAKNKCLKVCLVHLCYFVFILILL